jgi:TonB-dependent receptor
MKLLRITTLLLFFTVSAQAADGVIEGRVMNASSGNFLNNVRVAVRGTTLVAHTNEMGEYRLPNVPVGAATVTASYVGMEPQVGTVNVSPGVAARLDFELRLLGTGPADQRNIVKLEAFTVEEREMTGQAIALHEQRTAPNIKNVVSLDEFADMGEGNIGEFLKLVPGLDIAYTPAYPQYVTIRGMPSSGTLVMVDGVMAASSSANDSRQFDLSTAVTGNVDRMEVTKTPTPDMPANAVGGSINVISKSGFSRQKPLLSYNLFGTYNQLGGIEEFSPSLGKAAGPDAKSSSRYVQPAFNLSYILPLNKSLGFTFAASRAPRRADLEFFNPTWDRVRLIQTQNRMNNVITEALTQMVSATVDWKMSERDSMRASFLHSNRDSYTRQNIIISSVGANATGGPNFSQGAATGVGSVVQDFNLTTQLRDLDHATLTYRHDGDRWKLDASLAYSKGGFERRDVADGFFSGFTTTNANLIVRYEGLDGIESRRVPRVTATNRAGATVNPFDGNTYSVTAAASSPIDIKNDIFRAAVNAGRAFQFAVPVSLKAGLVHDQQLRDVTGGSKSWAFNPPNGATGRLASNYDLIAADYSNRWYFTDVDGKRVQPRWLSSTKLFELYKANPQWFTLNEAAAHTGEVNASKKLEETVTAAFIRGDAKFLDQRLWLVGGVRFERTETEGRGPLNDISAVYVKNPNGTYARDAAGRLIPITANALERAKLQYKERGTHATRSYSGYYPSLNSSYNLSENVVIRAAYARTIGRPNLNEIIPGTTITDPDSESVNRIITVVNAGLEPWTANNYDFTAEAYHIQGAVASASLFQKDISNFFATDRRAATPDLLAQYELPPDYIDYDIITKRNAGAATIRGFELSYRQSLSILGPWARGIQVFGNMTSMNLSGPNADDFAEFSPRNINWGASYVRARFNFKVNISSNKWVRRSRATASATVPAGSYTYREAQTRIDLSSEYRFTKTITVYASVRNLFASPLRGTIHNSDLPGYAWPNAYQFSPALFTLGVKGDF